MGLDNIMSSSLFCMESSRTVFEAAELMCEKKIGAIIVGNPKKMEGIFSERDVLNKIVAKARDPKKVKLSEVMSSPVKSISIGVDPHEALKVMNKNSFRHLPVSTQDGAIVGILSIRDLFGYIVKRQNEENESLLQFLSADGSGG